jgi:hypothetical protein
MNTFYLVVMSCCVRVTVCSWSCMSVSVCVCVTSSSAHLIPPHGRLSLTPESISLLLQINHSWTWTTHSWPVFLTIVIELASFSSKTLPSFSLIVFTLSLHICLLLLSKQSELNFHVQRLSTFSYEISFDMDLWNLSFSIRVPHPLFSSLNFDILNLHGKTRISAMQPSSLANLVEFWFFLRHTRQVSKKCKSHWMFLQHKKYEKCS